MNICEHLTVTARILPQKEAMVFEGRRYSYEELDGLSESAAQQLSNLGVLRGDRIAIMLPNVPAFVVWYYAALRVGAVAVSVSTRLTPSEVNFVISDCDAHVLIALPESLSSIGRELPECVTNCLPTSELGDESEGHPLSHRAISRSGWADTEPDDAALILYTSGTTGFAKGATLSHMNVRSNVNAFNHLCNMQSEDRILLAVPLFHCFGQNALLNSAFNIGATIVLQRKFDLNESKQLITSEKVTQLYGVPMMFRLFLESCEPSDLSTINYCFSAAAPLPIQIGRRWQEKFSMPINEGYGLTETSPFASYNHRTKFVPGSIGTPIDCVEMKIVDTETREESPPGELGEIAIRGPNVMLGYWNRSEDTAHAIRNGWFHSGDIGSMDENGYFYIVDRVKDMISVGGLKVFPAEVERVLLEHASVSQVAVVGIEDGVFGEQVVAFIVASEPSENSGANDNLTTELMQHAKNNLANYKIPRTIALIDELPRNPSGKILKTRLREMHPPAIRENAVMPLEDQDQTDSADSRPSIVSASNSIKQPRKPTLRFDLEKAYPNSRAEIAVAFVQKLVQSITESDQPPDPRSRFLDAGMDSLMIVEMSSQIQVEVGTELEIPATLVFDHPRICELGEFLVQTITSTDRPENSTNNEKPNGNLPTDSDLQDEIVGLTEQQALQELLKELDA